ncbi:D-TA family PLP-dependent enzyme [Lutimonas sp.]|uniref:D-TA family PLP-dependent enzyme n=1 Tax=Lutimonas sp. TaxID=1872403 RepID=UPI003D9B5E6F
MNWYELKDSHKLESPSLLVYPDRIQYNAELMCSMAKDHDRLRPHIKTHKMAEVIEIQLQLGINKYKCATISEAELLARSGATDILLAMQPVARHLDSFLQLMKDYPEISFSTLVDSEQTHLTFRKAAQKANMQLNLWIDINNGMNRTGILPNETAVTLFHSLQNDPEINLLGLHVYDGHIHNGDLNQREMACNKDYHKIAALIERLEKDGAEKPLVVAGGTPTFPIHEKRDQVELSPGTPLLWDYGYASNYRDLKFLPAAILMTRIVSKPDKNLICFDLGHKSVASEMKLPRVHFLSNNNFKQISQSEEHLVVACDNSDEHAIGDTHFALPIHVCPTVSKFPYAYAIKDHIAVGKWMVAARDH